MNISNKLPDLPSKHIKREAKITPKILKWFKDNFAYSVALEIKVSKGKSIPKSDLKDHQLKALLAAKSSSGMSHKLSDIGHIRQPFDAFQLKNTHAFVVCVFPAYKVCLAIDPEVWEGATIATPPTLQVPLWT